MVRFRYYIFIKCFLDMALVLPALIITLPLMALIGYITWLTIGLPVLFCQQRPGLHRKPFSLIKFRTMADIRDKNGNLLSDAQRLTPFGKWLRNTSLDELPELINVLKGEMSLVGPRPLLMQYLECYTPEQMRRHEVKPGITGWAQVNGRNALTWEEKFKLDVWYVDHQSFGLDLKILWMTIVNVIRRKGINQPGHATAEEFKGTLSIHEESISV